MLKINIFILCTFISSKSIYAKSSFDQVLQLIDLSSEIQAKSDDISSVNEQSNIAGSWGDPKFKVSAMNFPKSTLSKDSSMMTAVQFGLSQKFSLSGKYGALKKSKLALSKAKKNQLLQLKRKLAYRVWKLSIDKEKQQKVQNILLENLSWMKNNLQVTKKLYSTGKLSQQAILDIKIRLAELETQIDKNKNSIEIIKFQMAEILVYDKPIEIDLKTLPWDKLNNWSKAKDTNDFQIKSLQYLVNSQESKLSAQKRNFIPDVTIGVNYTKRNNLDGVGDFVGASITIPIPLSSKSYSLKNQAVFNKMSAEKKYRSYLIAKNMKLNHLKIKLIENEKELSTQINKNVQFAKSSRDIVSKSYARGGADYIKFLRSELQYQNQLIKKANLEANLKIKKLDYLFLVGDSLGLKELK
jgi:outer membrane protein TolC